MNAGSYISIHYTYSFGELYLFGIHDSMGALETDQTTSFRRARARIERFYIVLLKPSGNGGAGVSPNTHAGTMGEKLHAP